MVVIQWGLTGREKCVWNPVGWTKALLSHFIAQRKAEHPEHQPWELRWGVFR